MSQAGKKLTAPARDLDLEDYRQDHGTRMSHRKHDLRRNRHRSAQQDRRHLELQQHRASPAPSPPPTASRANSDPGPPPTPAPSPPPEQARTRRGSKRRGGAESPTLLYSNRTRDRRLGRSSAKSRRSPTPPPVEELFEDAELPPAEPEPGPLPAQPDEPPPADPPADPHQGVLFLSKGNTGATTGRGEKRADHCNARSNLDGNPPKKNVRTLTITFILGVARM